jgi:hypothetical protein
MSDEDVQFTVQFKERITVHTRPCPFCDEPHSVEVNASGFQRWAINGEYIQNALPELSNDDRELLMTGTCSECWDRVFPEEDEEEE